MISTKIIFKTALCFSFLLTTTTVVKAAGPDSEEKSYHTFSCVQGLWTQKALEQTNLLISSIKTLSENPACKGIESALGTLLQTQSSVLTPSSAAQEEISHLENTPERIGAVRGTLLAGGSGDANFTKLAETAMIKETLRNGVAEAATFSNSLDPNSVVKSSIGFSKNRQTFYLTGALLEQMAGILPQFDTCLVGAPDQGAAILGSFFSLAAAYTASGDQNLRTSNILNSLLTMLRNRKFTRSLQTLQNAQFWSSMSCLLESTTESYCTVVDNLHLLKENQKKSADANKVAVDHPLAGYYIMSIHLPNVLTWLNKLQFGIVPQWTTDANFKQMAYDNVTNFQKIVWNVIGSFNDQTQIYRFTTKDLKSKRNFLFQMLQNTVMALQTEQKLAGVGTINFFTMSIGEKALPFYLIGRGTNIPAQVAKGDLGGVGTPWDDWIFGNGSFSNAPEFENPDHLIEVIRDNLQKLAAEADKKASDFYRQRIIVNQANLATEAMVSLTYSARQSLAFIYGYLKDLETRLIAGIDQGARFTDDKGIVAGLQDAQYRIKKSLRAFEKLGNYDELKHETDEDSKRTVAAYEELVKTVYDQFDILKQRDSYLSNALSNYVTADYALRVRSGAGFGVYETNLLISSGSNLLQILNTLHGTNPAYALVDLNSANMVNMQNIAGFERAFLDSFVKTIDYFNLIIGGHGVTDAKISQSSANRLWNDAARLDGIFCNERPIACFFSSFMGPSGRMFTRHMMRPDLYPSPGLNNETYTYPQHDTGSDDFKGFRNKLCIQALALNGNKDYIKKLCADAILESGYESEDPAHFFLNANYNAYVNLPEFLNVKDRQGVSHVVPNTKGHDSQICAYRDFKRRNLVKWMTENLSSVSEIPEIK